MPSYFERCYTVWDSKLTQDQQAIARGHEGWFNEGDLTSDSVRERVKRIATEIPNANFAFEEGTYATLLRIRSGKVIGPTLFSVGDADEIGRVLDFEDGVPDTVIATIRAAEEASKEPILHEIEDDELFLVAFSCQEQVLPVLRAIVAADAELEEEIMGAWQMANAVAGRGWVAVKSTGDGLILEEALLQPLQGNRDQLAELHWTFETATRAEENELLTMAELN